MLRAANLLGKTEDEARWLRVGVLSRAVNGDFSGLGTKDGASLDADARRDWARVQMVELIDATCDEIEDHAETLDLSVVAKDRAEAGERATFDASKPAALARRYEAEATRGFYKALREFRKVEAEAAERASAPPSRAGRPDPDLASFGEDEGDDAEIGSEAIGSASMEAFEQISRALDAEGRPVSADRSSKSTA